MKIAASVLAIFFFLMVNSCGAEITGTVVDAETGKPIEEAVVLVEWTITKGLPGMSRTNPSNIVEIITGNGGKFSVNKTINSFNNPPRVTVYKKGYVAWNSEYIFPSWEKRKKSVIEDGVKIKLEIFKEEYSRKDHVNFLNDMTHWGKIISEAYRWEELEKERER